MTYEKRFRLSVVVKYESAAPLSAVDNESTRKLLQDYIDYARDKFAEMPGISPKPIEVVVEPLVPAVSLRERVDMIARALERQGFDVS